MTEFLGRLKHRHDTTPSCDHTSVGVIARDPEGRILLVERMKFPIEIPLSATDFVRPMEPSPSFGWAPPSGHLDGQTYPVACFNEFEEETGLRVVGAPRPLILKNPIKYFKCRRGGEYHSWQIFEVNWRGELKPSRDETKNAKWCDIQEIRELAMRTWLYRQKVKDANLLQEELARSMLKKIEREWMEEPGLEPVWYEFFRELKII